jgi:hypothetical protein
MKIPVDALAPTDDVTDSLRKYLISQGEIRADEMISSYTISIDQESDVFEVTELRVEKVIIDD